MIRRIKLKPNSQEWHNWRHKTGVGGSTTPYVLSEHSEELARLVWKSVLQQHMEDIGEPVQPFMGNVPTEAGNYMEDRVLVHKFRFWNLETYDEMEMYANIKENKRLNKVIRPKATFWNSKYPWLYNSPDACGYNWDSGEWYYNVECKNTNSMEADRYDNKISPAFIAQVMQGLHVTEKKLAYVIIQIDGTWTEVVPVEYDKEYGEKIEYFTALYWQRILECRNIKREYGIKNYYGVSIDFFDSKQKEGIMMLQQREPELQGTKPEFEFIKDMIKPTPEYSEREGTQQEWEYLLRYRKADDKIKAFTELKNKAQEEVTLSMGGYHQIYFGAPEEKQYFSYKPDKNGRCSARFSKSLKKEMS